VPGVVITRPRHHSGLPAAIALKMRFSTAIRVMRAVPAVYPLHHPQAVDNAVRLDYGPRAHPAARGQVSGFLNAVNTAILYPCLLSA